MGDLRRPQSLNRYTYVMNNPLKLIDPTGLLGIDFSECPEPKAFCSEIDQNKVKDETVAVDPGHGSPSSENSPPAPGAVANGLVERNLTLALANAVTAELNRMGINVIQTRNGDVTTFPGTANLWRVQLAEEGGASIFVSIHLNSGDGEGIEILHNQLGKTLAESILNANTVFKRRPKAIIDANGRGFTVLDRFSGPSVIVEAGFISNRSDVGKMKNRTLKIGKEIATGIKHYLEKQ